MGIGPDRHIVWAERLARKGWTPRLYVTVFLLSLGGTLVAGLGVILWLTTCSVPPRPCYDSNWRLFGEAILLPGALMFALAIILDTSRKRLAMASSFKVKG